MSYQSLRVNGERLKKSLLDLAWFGGTSQGGVHRLALTEEDRQARLQFIEWMKKEGLQVAIDEMGNVFGRRSGLSNQEPPVLTGSHIDSQPKGGKFDGAYGAMAALEVVRTLNENDVKTKRPIEIVSWTNEEGSRFSPPMIGSGVFAGAFTLDYAYSRTDKQGRTLGSELENISFKGSVPCLPRKVYAYFELHIEQGPILESEGKTIGVVEGILGIAWFDVVLVGEQNQAGPTPMYTRKDPLVAAADMIRAIRNIPSTVGPDVVSTVGSLDVIPNSRNTIPGEVRFTVDFRSRDSKRIDRCIELMKMEIAYAAKREGVTAKIEEVWRVPFAEFSDSCLSLIHI